MALSLALTACSNQSATVVNTESATADLANPASVYCQYLGGQSHSSSSQNGVSTQCELPDGTACEEWALYRGECALDAEISQPFDFCASVGTTPVLSASGSDPRKLVPQALLAPMLEQGLVNANMPEDMQAAVRWRCMESQVYVCPLGANLPCEEKADLSQTPDQAMQDFCRENPDAPGLPAYVTGRATVYAWSCNEGVAVAGKQLSQADAQGYLAKFWHLLQP